MEAWRAADIKCPYYISMDSSKRYICCEGMESETRVSIKFRRREVMEEYIARHCGQICSDCGIRRLNNEKYESLG